jgi:hypothetical protein
LENFENFKKLKTQYKDWTLDITIPMITSQTTYGIDNFLKKVFFIQSKARVVYNSTDVISYGEPFWKPFSQSIFITIQQNNKAPKDKEFIKLRDAILKFSAEHDTLATLEQRYFNKCKVEEITDGEKGQGSTSRFRSSNSAGLGSLGLMGLIPGI